ncbi:hypothetical protein PYR73_16845 (plasmid) [Acinetobacter soli]|nr:hypothetical protein PYR73_16845 [Acinetobacter soli]
MQYENIHEAKTPLKSMITRSHAYIRLLVEKVWLMVLSLNITTVDV